MYNISVLNNTAVMSFYARENFAAQARNKPDSDLFWNDSHTRWDGEAYNTAYREWLGFVDKARDAEYAANDKLDQMCKLIGVDSAAVCAFAKSLLRYEKRNGYRKPVDPSLGGWTASEKSAYMRLVSTTKPEYKSGRGWDQGGYGKNGFYAFEAALRRGVLLQP